MLRFPSLLAGAIAGLFAAPLARALFQDPLKPPPAQDPPAKQQPTESPKESKEPIGKPPKHALEGVYELRRRVIAGQVDTKPSRGYLAITNRHMFLCISAPGSGANTHLVHAGVRTWEAVPERDRTRTVVLVGWLTDDDGTIHLERPGQEELRRIDLMQGGVRVMQHGDRWLEFERIE